MSGGSMSSPVMQKAGLDFGYLYFKTSYSNSVCGRYFILPVFLHHDFDAR